MLPPPTWYVGDVLGMPLGLNPAESISASLTPSQGLAKGCSIVSVHAPASIGAGHVRRKMQMPVLSVERESVRGVSGGTGANCEDSVEVRLVEREFVLKDHSVRVSLRSRTH